MDTGDGEPLSSEAQGERVGGGKQSRGRRDLRGRLVEAKGKKVEVGHD